MGAAGGEGAARPQKLERKLPPYYLPQGLGQILPRIMPLSEIRNYGFARYVPESRLVEMEYVDVRAEQDVTFGGKMVRAVPISDRIGLDGPRTLHYMTRDGDYLGWSNASTKTEVIATEGSALLKLWGNADLSRPAPAPAPAPVPNNMGSGGTGVMPPQPRAPGAR